MSRGSLIDDCVVDIALASRVDGVEIEVGVVVDGASPAVLRKPRFGRNFQVTPLSRRWAP